MYHNCDIKGKLEPTSCLLSLNTYIFLHNNDSNNNITTTNKNDYNDYGNNKNNSNNNIIK